ncbi:glycosyltransferase family 39 protein [Neolewinella sp.]|uniref:glycosyltransferase family 39 protein n=1 Tax=Neolewinella sp. TaxID=2993543 RepID=UPI003B5191E1
MPRRPSLIALGFLVSLALSALLHRSVFTLDMQGRHNWRQAQTMWNVRNFVRYDNDITHPRVSHFNGSNNNLLRYEFPIMQWSIAQVQRALGEDIWIARTMVWLIGAFGLLGFYLLLRILAFPAAIALVGTFLLQFSPLFYFYTINILPDNLALAAGIWYLYFCFAYLRDRRTWQLLGLGSFLLLAALAKLPFAMFGIVGLVFCLRYIWVSSKSGRVRWQVVGVGLAHLAFLYPAYRWYAMVMPGWKNNPVVYGIFANAADTATNWRIFNVQATDIFPYSLLSPAVWLPFALGVFYTGRRTAAPFSARPYIWALVFITFLFLALQWNTIGTVHDYYLLPFLPWMYITVTAGVQRLWQWSKAWTPTLWRWLPLAVVAAILIGAPLDAYQLRKRYWEVKFSYGYEELRDVFTHQAALQAAVDDDAMVIVLNDPSMQIFTWLIRKRGYVFGNNNLKPAWLDDMRKRGATYLYSSSRYFDEQPGVQERVDSLLLEAGNIRVYRLK